MSVMSVILIVLCTALFAHAQIDLDTVQGHWALDLSEGNTKCKVSLDVAGLSFTSKTACSSDDAKSYVGSISFGSFYLTPTFEADGKDGEKVKVAALFVRSFNYDYRYMKGKTSGKVYIVFGSSEYLGLWDTADEKTYIYKRVKEHPLIHGVHKCTNDKGDPFWLVVNTPQYSILNVEGIFVSYGLLDGVDNTPGILPIFPLGAGTKLNIEKLSDGFSANTDGKPKSVCKTGDAAKATAVDGSWVTYGDCNGQFFLWRGFFQYASSGALPVCNWAVMGVFTYDSDKREIYLGHSDAVGRLVKKTLKDVKVTSSSLTFPSDSKQATYKQYSKDNLPYSRLFVYKKLPSTTTEKDVANAILKKRSNLKAENVNVVILKKSTRAGEVTAQATVTGEKSEVDGLADDKISIGGTEYSGDKASSADLSTMQKEVETKQKETESASAGPSLSISLAAFVTSSVLLF
jgi:hypothetical protein